MYNLITNSNRIIKSQRGKAVHLLNAAMAEKKRKRPEKKTELRTLVLGLRDASPTNNAKRFKANTNLPMRQDTNSRGGRPL